MSTGIRILIYIIILIIFLVCSAFVSAQETAYTAIGEIEWKLFLKKRKRQPLSVKLVNLMYRNYSFTVATSLLINNLLAVGVGVFTTIWLSEITSVGVANAISLVLVTFLLVIFGDYIPKNLVRKHAIFFVTKTSYVGFIIWCLCYPMSFFMGFIFRKQKKQAMSKKDFGVLTNLALDDEIFDNHEAELVSSALELDHKTVKNFMTNNPVFTNKDDSLAQLLLMYSQHGYTRIIMMDGDEVYGVLNYKILFNLIINPKTGNIDLNAKINIKDAIQEPMFLPAETKLDEALREMQTQKTHIAIVSPSNKDEKMLGVIALEDIIEELVGEIYDENDDELDIQIVNDVSWRVNPKVKASHFINKHLQIKYNFILTNRMNLKDFFIQYFKVEKLLLNQTYQSDAIILEVDRDLDTRRQIFIVTKLHEKFSDEKMKVNFKTILKDLKKRPSKKIN